MFFRFVNWNTGDKLIHCGQLSEVDIYHKKSINQMVSKGRVREPEGHHRYRYHWSIVKTASCVHLPDSSIPIVNEKARKDGKRQRSCLSSLPIFQLLENLTHGRHFSWHFQQGRCRAPPTSKEIPHWHR
jgi:hypothetical protein